MSKDLQVISVREGKVKEGINPVCSVELRVDVYIYHVPPELGIGDYSFSSGQGAEPL